MNKTKKALIAAFACSAVLAGAFGLAACNNSSKPEKHDHVWSETWTVATKPGDDTPGKATRTCNGKGTCDATAEDKEYTLPKLTTDSALTEGYSKGTDSATCSATGSVQYTYNKDGVNVSFNVDTPINSTEHSYKSVNDGPDGHHDECEHNSAHKTSKVEHNTNGTDGACSVCGYLETAIQLKTDVTVTGATTAAPKLYSLTVEEGEYELLVAGNAVDTNTNTQIAIGTYTDGTFTDVKTGAQRTLTLTAGKYYIQASANVTFKLAPASEHQHAFNESAWEKNDTKHWHPAICVHTDEKGGEDDHSYVWDDADRDGIQEGACVCGQTSLKYNATELDSENQTLTVEQSGNYTSTIGKGWYCGQDENENDMYDIAYQNYTLTNGDAAKKYTVKILTDNTSIIPDGMDAINEEGASFSVVLEANQTLDFMLKTNDTMTIDEDYAVEVIFRVIVEDTPEAGTIERPVAVSENGETGKEGVTAGEKVYFKLSGKYQELFFDKSAKITFGSGVTVYALGSNINNNEPEAVQSGDIVSIPLGSDYFVYAVSTGADCKVTFESCITPGNMGNPVDVQIDADKVNNADVSFDIQNYWFKLQSAEGGKYLIKPVNPAMGITFSLYGSNGDDYENSLIATADGAIVAELAANSTVYLTASEIDNTAFEFTVTPFNALTDEGFAPSDPLEITDGTEVHKGIFYYTYTATENGVVTLTFNREGEGDDSLMIYHYANDSFVADYGHPLVDSGVNTYAFNARTGMTYYIGTVNYYNVAGTVDLDFEAYAAHDYVITVTDGTNTYNNVTVSLVYQEYDPEKNDMVEREITGATNNGDGTYTFAEVDPSVTYTVKLAGLPAGYDYYEEKARIPFNTDTTSQLTITLEATQTYKVKVALPDGAELPQGATLEGIKVMLKVSSRTWWGSGSFKAKYTVLTNDQGVAEFSVLDPVYFEDGEKVDFTYDVFVEVPEGHSLYGKFAYIAERSYYGTIYTTVDKDNCDITDEPLTLTELVEYTVTLTDGDNNLAEGTKVTVNGKEYTIGADGTFTIAIGPNEDVEIEVEGYEVGYPEFDDEEMTITATCTDPASKGLTVGVTKEFENADGYMGISFTLEVEEGGKFTITTTGDVTVAVEYYNEDGDLTPIYDNDGVYTLDAGTVYTITIFSNDYSDTVSGTITVDNA